MAGNYGKFVDRSPSILPAGKLPPCSDDSVPMCLRSYTIDDAKSTLKSLTGRDKKCAPDYYKLPAWSSTLRRGIHTEIRPILRPPVRTRYQTLINELKETTYESRWNQVDGKCRDPIPGLPAGLDPLTTTFGITNKFPITVKELVNPPVGVYQVLYDGQVAHDLYKRTHNDYNPGEQVCRNYLEPAFERSRRFGGKTTYDPRGIWVRCACTWHQNEPVVRNSRIQAEFIERTQPQLGRRLAPNKPDLPEDFSHGIPCKREFYGVEDLLKDEDCPPCLFKRDLKTWMAAFNKFKLAITSKVNHGFSLDDLKGRIRYFDCDRTGWVPLSDFYKICKCYGVMFDSGAVEPLLRLLRVVDDGDRVDYDRFVDLIDTRKPPFELFRLQDVPSPNRYFITTSQAACCDYLVINNANSPPAGVPSIRHDLSRPIVPTGGIRADLENLGDETSAGNLLNPSIYTNYGLSYRDFFIPRSKETLRLLFERIGYKISGQSFDELWGMGAELDKSGGVCVDTFDKLVKNRYPDKRVVVDEATC